MAVEIAFQMLPQTLHDGRRNGLTVERLVEEFGDLGAALAREGRIPLLPQRMSFVPGEAVQALEVDDVGPFGGLEGGEGGVKETIDRLTAFVRDGIGCDQGGEGTRGPKAVIATPDAAVAGDQSRLTDEPGAAGTRVQPERGFVK